MKSHKYEGFLVWVGYFLALLLIALFVRDIPNQPDAFNTTLQQLIKISTMGDPGHFAMAALDIFTNGWISEPNEWILNLWPPGFILLQALLIKVFGEAAPVILLLQILAVVLFAFVLTLLYEFLNARMRSRFAFVLPILIFVFPVSRVFLLQPTGITLGESFSIGFFLIFVLLTLRSVERSQIRYAAYAGLCLALSAYFRSQFEIILLALSGFGVLLIIAFQLKHFNKFIQPDIAKPIVRTMAVVLLVAHSATIPWRAYHWIYHGNPGWVQTASVTFGNSVMTSDYLESVNGGFVVAGGGNLVCRIDPTTCGDTANAKKLFVKTFIKHPIEWYSLKLGLIGEYWFSSVQNWSAIGVASTFMDMVLNSIFLFSLFALVTLLFTRRLRSQQSWPVLIWFSISLFSAYLLIFTVQQFEARYFYFPKIAGITMLLITASLYFGSIRKI